MVEIRPINFDTMLPYQSQILDRGIQTQELNSNSNRTGAKHVSFQSLQKSQATMTSKLPSERKSDSQDEAMRQHLEMLNFQAVLGQPPDAPVYATQYFRGDHGLSQGGWDCERESENTFTDSRKFPFMQDPFPFNHNSLAEL